MDEIFPKLIPLLHLLTEFERTPRYVWLRHVSKLHQPDAQIIPKKLDQKALE